MHVALTLDIDWAPDAAIDFVRELLVAHGVRATFFVTHASPAVDRFRERPDLFELGVHPNFLAGSSHGATPEEVLAYCMRLVPDATSVRTHALVQSTPIYDVLLRTTPVRLDASILLPHARHVEAVEYQWQGTTMLRVPYVWEDDIEMLRDEPRWTVDHVLDGEGPRVFDFHPIHVFLNSADMKPYEALKAAVRPLSAATREQMAPFVHPGQGAGTAFRALVERFAREGGGLRMRDIYDGWRKGASTK